MLNTPCLPRTARRRAHARRNRGDQCTGPHASRRGRICSGTVLRWAPPRNHRDSAQAVALWSCRIKRIPAHARQVDTVHPFEPPGPCRRATHRSAIKPSWMDQLYRIDHLSGCTRARAPTAYRGQSGRITAGHRKSEEPLPVRAWSGRRRRRPQPLCGDRPQTCLPGRQQ